MKGECILRVNAGKYYVHAILPGPGPGYFYNKPVTVKSNETVEVKLKACLACM